jgi:hypothetical protein
MRGGEDDEHGDKREVPARCIADSPSKKGTNDEDLR